MFLNLFSAKSDGAQAIVDASISIPSYYYIIFYR